MAKKKNVINIIKKDGSLQKFEADKIISAVSKSSERVGYTFSEDEKADIIEFVEKRIERSGKTEIPVSDMHNYVESALDMVNPKVAKSYRDYRNWKNEWSKDFGEDLYEKANKILYIGDKENANADSALVSTKRSLTLNELGKMLYKRVFLSEEEKKAIDEGTIYVHDMNARRDTMNCCLFDIETVLTGGFEMGNIWYNEPKTADTAYDVIGDIVLSAASQQYGGFTLPEIDKVLDKYAQKSYDMLVSKYTNRCKMDREDAEALALEDVQRELEQGFQGWEYKFNTVASSRGDYPFITITFGLSTTKFGKMISKAALKVRMEGQGKKGKKKPVLFPKLVFLYDEKLHGPGGELEDVFEAGVKCSSKTMYPDWLSLTGEGYIASMYKQYGKVISPMGCRAFLSPWWEKGGMYKADETDTPVFVGRFNIGAVSLNLPLIYLKAKNESKDFYELLDYYLELIRKLHLRTYDYLGEMRASTNPLAYCEGGFLGGHLQPSDNIAPILKAATASFGITALNELQEVYNNTSLVEDGQFALDVLTHINEKVNEFKEEDSRLYAIYGTPAENLCGAQVTQIRSKYGIIPKVSDKTYVSNSFHCHVSENITPTEKQDIEYRFWEKCNGGKIQYVRYPVDYNLNAIKALIRRAMAMGFYEGVNMSLAYCDDCGHQELEMDVCPVCGSRNLTKIDRMNGYLAYSRIHGSSRLADHKMSEIADRKSM
ncbi:MAG: anaerobic ribonucleoside-triphosphate reductase [Lachnospiraceae bacterium]|nr:anaerobic ribonucleoside-triphosphate reductase [Lachnospiraceae bacterium]